MPPNGTSATTYPLPALLDTRLCYRHMPDGDIWIHKITREDSGTEKIVPVLSPAGVVATLHHLNQDDTYGLRVAVQDMGGQTRLVDFDRADLGCINAAAIKAALFAVGFRVDGDGESIVVSILKVARLTREMVIIYQPGLHRLTPDGPIFTHPSGEIRQTISLEKVMAGTDIAD